MHEFSTRELPSQRRSALLAVLMALCVAVAAPLSPPEAQAAAVPGAVRRELNRAESLLRHAVIQLGQGSGGIEIVRQSDRVILRVPARLLFEPDRVQVADSADTARVLAVPEQLLKMRRLLVAQITVYSDNIGGASFNQTQSQLRALALLSALTAAGIPAARVQAQGAGPVRAVASNDTPQGRWQNRRVEFVFQRPTARARVSATAGVRPVRAAAHAGA